jgi:UDP-N-acetylmuramate dehydrogenase
MSELGHGALATLTHSLAPGARITESMASHTSIRVGGPADVFVWARTKEQLVGAIERASSLGVPWRVVGAGSNLLVADGGIEGLVVRAAMAGSRQELTGPDTALIHADAGCLLATLARRTANLGWTGLEWAVNVPGTVGAAVVNNSGAFGSSTAESLSGASLYFRGAGCRTATSEDLGMGYRTSALKRGELEAVVLGAAFRLDRGDSDRIRSRIAEIQHVRQATQPGGASLGSIFANPKGDAAGRLVESAGLKGCRRGGAEISRLHANFILNRGGARSAAVFDLIRHAQMTVWGQGGKWLHPEVELVGRWGNEQLGALSAPPGSL